MQTSRESGTFLLSHSRVSFSYVSRFQSTRRETAGIGALHAAPKKQRNARAVPGATLRFQRVDEPIGTTFWYN